MPINHDMMHARIPDEVSALKARITDLEKENAELKESLYKTEYHKVQGLIEVYGCKTVAEFRETIKDLQCQLVNADKAIAELKNKLEDVQATAYAESVDAGMRERRLKRALWLSRLKSLRNFSVLAYFQTIRAKGKESNMDFNEMAYRIDLARVKCREMAEEYK